VLTIRNDQLASFSTAKKAGYVDRLLPHLEADYPSWYAERQKRGAVAFVEKVMGIGERHNIQGQAAVSTLVDLMVEFGENFASSPDREWAVKLLAHPSLPDQIKVSMLAERLRARTGGRRIVEMEAG
jgi:hypothetical protein